MKIRKSRCIELDRTHCCTGKFNIALSLYRVLESALYFSKSLSEVAARGSAVAIVLWPLRVTIVCFLGQESNLQSSTLQQRHKLFLSCFLCLSPVNLPLLASLEERSTCGELGCFFRAKDRDNLEGDLVDEATKDVFDLLWETIALPVVKAFPYF